VALDFDGTLYEGAARDDGPAGIVITAAHAALHRRLLEMRDGDLPGGRDAQRAGRCDRLFAERKDWSLRREDFSR